MIEEPNIPKISGLMTSKVKLVAPGNILLDAIIEMAEASVSCLVYVRDSKPAGILTETKILNLVADGLSLKTPVENLEFEKTLQMHSDNTIVDAVIAMEKSGQGALIVTDKKGEVEGILTLTDIIKKTSDMDFVSRQKVKYTMSKNIILVSEMDSVTDCIGKMAKLGVDNVIVTAQKKGVGIFTRRDAIRALRKCLTKSRDTSCESEDACNINEAVYQHMTPTLITISADSFLFEASRLMIENNIRRIVVTDSKGHPRGVISQKELLKRLDSNYSELMSIAVSESVSPEKLFDSSFIPLIESSFEPVLVFSRERIVNLNEKAAELLGRSADELKGKNIADIVFHEDFPSAKDEISRRCREELFNETFSFRVAGKNENVVHLECRAQKFIDSKGTEKIWFLARDITGQKEKEMELIGLKEKAEEASLVKSAFLANISHELRTPLTSIIGFGKLINDNLEIPENVKKQSAIVVRQGKNLLSMINKILEISEADKLEKNVDAQKAYLPDIVNTAISGANDGASGTRHTITAEIDPELPNLAIVDSRRIGIALDQLIGNAMKFSGCEGEGNILVKAKKDGEKILFSVSDNGIGIPNDKFETIFENFVQLDDSICREYSGAGLGLPLAKMMVSNMGGEIWVESPNGKGSTFFFTVPLIPA